MIKYIERRCCGDDILLDFTSHSTKSAKGFRSTGCSGKKKGGLFFLGGSYLDILGNLSVAVSPLMRWHYREHRFLTDPLGYSLALLSLSLSLVLTNGIFRSVPQTRPCFWVAKRPFLLCLKGQLLAGMPRSTTGAFFFIHTNACMEHGFSNDT